MRTLATACLLSALVASSAPAQTVLYTLAGALAGDEFGSTVENVGDLDGDGTDDLAVGAPDADGTIFIPFPLFVTDLGRVTVFSGATGAELWTADGNFPGGSSFGATIARAPDANGDGTPDVLVGAPTGDGAVPDTGYARLLSGVDGSLIREFPGLQPASRFGDALCAGQLDGDPGTEFVVGAPRFDLDDNQGGALQEGMIYVFDMDDGSFEAFLPGTDYVRAHIQVGVFEWDLRHWGDDLVFLGDGDGDGAGEFAASAPFSSEILTSGVAPNTGFVRVVEPFGNGPDELFNLSAAGGAAGTFYGMTLGGYGSEPAASDHIVVGSPGEDLVYVLSTVQALTPFGMSLTHLFDDPCLADVTAVAAPGDIDGDGLVDLVTGSPGFTSGDVGRVCVLPSAPGGPIAELTGAPGERFGHAVGGFDADGDGRVEVAVGARLADAGGTDSGEVVVYTGFGCTTTASAASYGDGLAGTFGVPELSVSGPPVIDTTVDVTIGNAAGLQALALVLIGFAPTSIPAKGGTVLVVDSSGPDTLVLPVGGFTVPFAIPDDAALCGVDLYLQVIHVDNGAPLGAAFTPGLQLSFGE